MPKAHFRKLHRALRQAGWEDRGGGQRHHKWFCPCGQHILVHSASPGKTGTSATEQQLRRFGCPNTPDGFA